MVLTRKRKELTLIFAPTVNLARLGCLDAAFGTLASLCISVGLSATALQNTQGLQEPLGAFYGSCAMSLPAVVRRPLLFLLQIELSGWPPCFSARVCLALHCAWVPGRLTSGGRARPEPPWSSGCGLRRGLEVLALIAFHLNSSGHLRVL